MANKGNRKWRATKMTALGWVVTIGATSCIMSEPTAVPKDHAAMIDTSICELVSHPEKFSGKTVRIHAEYLDDGYQFPILIDRNCDTGGVVTSRQLLDPTVPNPLLNILQSGCAGSIGKKISGTWIGEYHWNEKNRPGTGKVPRWLDLLNIEDLVSYQEPGASNCGNP